MSVNMVLYRISKFFDCPSVKNCSYSSSYNEQNGTSSTKVNYYYFLSYLKFYLTVKNKFFCSVWLGFYNFYWKATLHKCKHFKIWLLLLLIKDGNHLLYVNEYWFYESEDNDSK